MDVILRAFGKVVSQDARHVSVTRWRTVDRGNCKGKVTVSERANLVAVSTISFPLMLEWGGTHWRVMSHFLSARWSRSWVVWIKFVEDAGWRDRRRWSEVLESVYRTDLPCG